MGNKHDVMYFLGANLILDVERQRFANRDQMIIVGHDMMSVLDLQEQTSKIATTSDCVGT
jgi:hypothetical protein